MSLREHWVSLLYRAATGTRKTRTLLTPIGLTIFAAFTAAFVLAALLADRLLGLPGFLPEGARLPVAISVLTVGAAITLWSALHFLRVEGTPVPFNPPPKVVQSGPYRYSRNPMVTGVFVLLFGLGFAFNSVSLVLLFTPLYVLAHVWELKRIEEPELERRLGEEYIEYRSRTPMFLPGLGRGSKLGHRGETDSLVNEKGASPARWLLRIFSILVLLALVIVLIAIAGLFVYEPSPAEGFGFSPAGKSIRLSDGRTLAYLETGDPNGRPLFQGMLEAWE